MTRAEKHPRHVHYARRVYARRFSMERENKAELMSRWREEQKKKKKAIKRAQNAQYVTQKRVNCTSCMMRNALWVKTKIADLAKNFQLYNLVLVMVIYCGNYKMLI